MAADLELQSIQALTQASDLLCQAPSPNRLLSPINLPLLPLSQTVNPRSRNLLDMWKRLNVTSQSVDMGFGVHLLDPCRAKISVPLLPVLKPAALQIALRRKNRTLVKRKEAETWLHPKVPRVLVNYLLEKQMKKSKEGWQQGGRKPFRIVGKGKGLPQLNGLRFKSEFADLHRSKSSMR